MRSKNKELMIKIQEYAEQFCISNSRTPSTAEIGSALGISKVTVFNYLKEMDELGMVSYSKGILRTRIADKMNDQSVQIPLVGSIPCGPPEEEVENIDKYYTFARELVGPGDFFILRAEGDSMEDADISSGDLVVVRQQQVARSGDIVAALVDGNSTLKRLKKEKGKCQLLPENREKNYPPITGNHITIQGVVVFNIKFQNHR